MGKSILTRFAIAALLIACGCHSSQSGEAIASGATSADAGRDQPTQTKESQQAMTPGDALGRLRAGNARFVAGQSQGRDLRSQVRATASGQYPYAVILSCLDSRQPVELIFDQGIGDVFNARVAGNVLNDDVLGSLEFACKVSGAKLIVVLGHSNCGAIKGSIDNVELGHLTGLLERVKPAISAVPEEGTQRTSKNDAFVQKVADANAHLVMRQIRERSPILREMIDQHQIGLAGGMYDLNTGQVTFYPN
jgi:carbonic anhydrase